MVRSPFSLLDWTTRRYFQPGVPWIAFLVLLYLFIWRIVRTASERAWFRQNPALPEVSWSFRNNINYQQSGVLFALHDMAQNRERFLER